MYHSNEDYTKISIKISKELLAHFDDYARSKNYQKRNDAVIDLIKKELDNEE